jgi:drug/metabolite transporter (DMT)-like permease
MKFLGFFLIVVSAVSFGLMPIFATFAYRSGLDVQTILLFRFLSAAIIVNVYIIIKKHSYPRGKVLVILLFMGAVLYSAQAFSYFSAVSLIGSSLTSILLYIYPALVLLFSTFLLRVKIHKTDILALCFTTVGAVLVVGLKFKNIDILGIIFGLGAALIYSIYIITGTKAMRSTTPITATGVIMIGSAFVYVLYGFYYKIKLPDTIEQWGWIEAIVVVSTLLSSVTFFAGLKMIGAVKASMISTLELVVTLVLSCMILGEKMEFLQMIGSVFILVAAILLAKERE